MTAAYTLLGLAIFWATGWLIAQACENRRERDVRACCPYCTPSRTSFLLLGDEVRPLVTADGTASQDVVTSTFDPTGHAGSTPAASVWGAAGRVHLT